MLKHLAIIMDGNGRWAKNNSSSKLVAYNKGADAAEKIIEHSKSIGIKYLTLYAFSSENWNRPKEDVTILMDILRMYLKNRINKIIEHGVNVKFIGKLSLLPDDIQKLMNDAQEKSKNYDNFFLSIAVSYGSRDEILDAAHKATIENKKFEDCLYTSEMPDPDLLIRTGGQHRLSNFLLWQLAYTELYFINKLWPDFNEEDLNNAITEFNKRTRTYGK